MWGMGLSHDFSCNTYIHSIHHEQLLDEISAALDSVSEAALHLALERVLQVGGGDLTAKSVWLLSRGDVMSSALVL